MHSLYHTTVRIRSYSVNDANVRLHGCYRWRSLTTLQGTVSLLSTTSSADLENGRSDIEDIGLNREATLVVEDVNENNKYSSLSMKCDTVHTNSIGCLLPRYIDILPRRPSVTRQLFQTYPPTLRLGAAIASDLHDSPPAPLVILPRKLLCGGASHLASHRMSIYISVILSPTVEPQPRVGALATTSCIGQWRMGCWDAWLVSRTVGFGMSVWKVTGRFSGVILLEALEGGFGCGRRRWWRWSPRGR